MKFILRSILCGCLLATIAHCVELEFNRELKKRLNMWLGNRLRRDLHSTLSAEQKLVRPDDIRDSIAHSSPHTNVRAKRSNPPRRQGCSLGTCTVHDLAHRLHQLNNKLKIGSAPVDKISPQGYGRRRRSVPERTLRLSRDQGRIRPVWSQRDSQIQKLEALLRRTWAGLWERRLSREEGVEETQCPLLCSKIFQMPQTRANFSPVHCSKGWRLSQSSAGCRYAMWNMHKLQLAHRHWIAQCGLTNGAALCLPVQRKVIQTGQVDTW